MNGRETNEPPKTIVEVVQSKPIVVDTSCKWVSAIWVSKADDITAGTARQILNHNQAVNKNCGKQTLPKPDK